MKIRSSRKASIFGIILGLILGLLGMVSGVYFGIIKPELDAGGSIHLPMLSIVVMVAILLSIVIITMILFRKRKSAADLDDKWK